MRVGIAGAGRLGSAIAERLLHEGFSVGIWNRTPEKFHSLLEKGANAHATPAELAKESECILTLLTDLDASRHVYMGPSGLLSCSESRLLVGMSTLPPEAHCELAGHVRRAGSKYLECPVVGSRDAALSGNLMALAAGGLPDLEQVRPVLNAICSRVNHVGDIGAAASVKLALNLPLIVYFEVMSEALKLVDHLNLDPHLMVSLLAESSGGPKFLGIMGQAIGDALSGASLPPAQNTVALFIKDLKIMLAEAHARGLELPLTTVALAEYQQVEATHPGDIDGMRLPALLLEAARTSARN